MFPPPDSSKPENDDSFKGMVSGTKISLIGLLMPPPQLEQINNLSRAGVLELGNALQLTLLRIGTTDDAGNFFAILDGELGHEVRDLVHHVLHNIPDPGVTTWLEESTPEELAGLEKLLAAAREFGYADDDLVDPPHEQAEQ